MGHVMPFWPSVIFVHFVVHALCVQRKMSFNLISSARAAWERGALPDFPFCSLFPFQQTTSGIGHRVKLFLWVVNQYTLNVRNNRFFFKHDKRRMRPQEECFVRSVVLDAHDFG